MWIVDKATLLIIE